MKQEKHRMDSLAHAHETRQFTDELVRDAIRFIESGRAPNAGDWDDFHVEKGHLIHTATKRQVVSHSEIVPLLTKLYAQPSWKSGRDRFHRRICERYIGVSRLDVMDFLHRQETWQLHQPIRRLRVRQTVQSSSPLDHWQMDLIDLTAHSALNNGNQYVLTVMDCFAKFAWAKCLKTKHAASVAQALREVFDDPVLRGRVPKIVQSDNGTEFKDDVSALLEARGIKHIFSAAYKPTTQGMIERFNGTLKRAVFEHMTQFNTRKWNDTLPEITRGYNASRHSVTGEAPEVLMSPSVSDALVDGARRRIRAAAAKRLAQSSSAHRFSVIYVGDTVRLSARTETEVRRRDLLGQSKGKQPNWSKQLFVVTHISAPSADALTLPSYRVAPSEGGDPLAQRFYRDDLQKIDPSALMVNEAKRPDYSHGAIFNQEAHLRRIRTRRSSAAEQRPQRKKKSQGPIQNTLERAPTRSRTHPRAPTATAGPQVYEVAEILQQKQHNRHPIFLVRWAGYPDEADRTWEPLQHIKNTEAFAAWRKKQRQRGESGGSQRSQAHM